MPTEYSFSILRSAELPLSQWMYIAIITPITNQQCSMNSFSKIQTYFEFAELTNYLNPETEQIVASFFFRQVFLPPALALSPKKKLITVYWQQKCKCTESLFKNTHYKQWWGRCTSNFVSSYEQSLISFMQGQSISNLYKWAMNNSTHSMVMSLSPSMKIIGSARREFFNFTPQTVWMLCAKKVSSWLNKLHIPTQHFEQYQTWTNLARPCRKSFKFSPGKMTQKKTKIMNHESQLFLMSI